MTSKYCFRKTLESSLDSKEIKPVNPKGNKSWIFIGRTDAKAEAPVLWPPDVNLFIGKDPGAGKDWRQEEKGMTKDEMIGWHHQLNGLEFEQAPGDGKGQGCLVCFSPWGHRVRHNWATEQWQQLEREGWYFYINATSRGGADQELLAFVGSSHLLLVLRLGCAGICGCFFHPRQEWSRSLSTDPTSSQNWKL